MTKKFAKRFSIMMMLFCAVVLLSCFWLMNTYFGVKTPASPNGEAKIDSDGFPEVDWNYWKNINSDVVGWITIPGTEINYPILQAHPNDRSYYLNHNVYKQLDFMGAVHVDADCAKEGLNSKNTIILAHSINKGASTAMFTPLIKYTDQEFANDHTRILIQTPAEKSVVDANSVQVINGGEPIKYTEFTTYEELYGYENNCYNNSNIQISENPPMTNQMFTLCTCSYIFNPSNERTLIYGSLKAKF